MIAQMKIEAKQRLTANIKVREFLELVSDDIELKPNQYGEVLHHIDEKKFEDALKKYKFDPADDSPLAFLEMNVKKDTTLRDMLEALHSYT